MNLPFCDSVNYLYFLTDCPHTNQAQQKDLIPPLLSPNSQANEGYFLKKQAAFPSGKAAFLQIIHLNVI